jgi:hypothetical protein
MNAETLEQTPPLTEGLTPPQPEAPITTDETPVNPEPEPKVTPEHEPHPEHDRPEGASRANAYQHGCAGTGAVVSPNDRDLINKRYDNLTLAHQPRTPRQNELLKTIATAEVLEEKCQNIGMALDQAAQRSAQLRWDHDQKVAAEALAVQLPKNPALIRAQLAETPQGATLLISRLAALLHILESLALTPTQISYVLDLLGVPTAVRVSGQTILEAPADQDPRVVARTVLQAEVAQLQDPVAVQARTELDQLHYTLAIQGTPVRISKDQRLMKRYQAMHARRRREAWAEFQQLRQDLRSYPDEVKEKLTQMAYDQRRQERVARVAAWQPSPAPAAKSNPAASPSLAPAPAVAPQPAPVAAAAPVAPQPAKPALFNWGGKSQPKASKNHPPRRDREAERAAKKAERDARHKQQKQHKHR